MDGQIELTSEGFIGDYPVAVPMVDMHTIGAGGGSIAYVDGGGLLNVGPESAGASPGPACYGQGGLKPTVTDANLVLGRLRVDGFLGQGMRLDLSASESAIKTVADQLGLSVQTTAEGIISIANEHMVRALRTISIQRGFDPQNFSLTSFGGAGGLHVCALADALNMQRAIVPVHGGVLSALGMLVAAPSRELSHTCIQVLQDSVPQQLEEIFAELETRGSADIQAELSSEPELYRSVDLRYKGQSFTLNLPWSGIKALQTNFHQLHRDTYGHELNMPIELVNLRLTVRGEASPFSLPEIAGRISGSEIRYVSCCGFSQSIPVYQREQLENKQLIQGPALILEKVSTTLVESGWNCMVDDWGNLLLSRKKKRG